MELFFILTAIIVSGVIITLRIFGIRKESLNYYLDRVSQTNKPSVYPYTKIFSGIIPGWQFNNNHSNPNKVSGYSKNNIINEFGINYSLLLTDHKVLDLEHECHLPKEYNLAGAMIRSKYPTIMPDENYIFNMACDVIFPSKKNVKAGIRFIDVDIDDVLINLIECRNDCVINIFGLKFIRIDFNKNVIPVSGLNNYNWIWVMAERKHEFQFNIEKGMMKWYLNNHLVLESPVEIAPGTKLTGVADIESTKPIKNLKTQTFAIQFK